MGLLSKAKDGLKEAQTKKAQSDSQVKEESSSKEVPSRAPVVEKKSTNSAKPPTQPPIKPKDKVNETVAAQPIKTPPKTESVPKSSVSTQTSKMNPGLENSPAQRNTDEVHSISSMTAANLPQFSPSAKREGVMRDDILLDLEVGANITTMYDTVLLFVQEKKTVKMNEIAKAVSMSESVVEEICRVLMSEELVQITYSLVIISSPLVTYTAPVLPANRTLSLNTDKRMVEEYEIMSDYVQTHVRIWSVPRENTPIYEIIPHPLGRGTEAFLLYVIDELSQSIPVNVDDVTDPEKIARAKKAVFDASITLIKKYLPSMSEPLQYTLAGSLLHLAYGLGDLDVIMADNWLEEVAINGDNEPLSLYHRKYGWLKTNKYFDKQSEIYNISSQIARKVGKQINSLTPIMDAHLQTGDRVAATLFPISTEGDTITIRRFSRNPWTIVHMIDDKIHTMSKEVMAFLWLAMQYEMNLLVVGGTASGKTSVLNTLCSLINPTNRIISIEDTREITLPTQLHWNWVPMQSKSPNNEGQGEVSMLDLIVASLRMRPDRIIVGEIRRKEQAEALFEAMHTGHSVCGTMHADTAEQIKHRLTQPPMDIPENELQALQLVIVQYRDRRKGVRRTLEVAEILPGSSDEKINLNYLYRWRPRNDSFAKEDQSIRIYEDLNLHTGMTLNEIDDDLAGKQEILAWMLSHRVMDVDKVGHVMRVYYKSPKLLLDLVRDGVSAKESSVNNMLQLINNISTSNVYIRYYYVCLGGN